MIIAIPSQDNKGLESFMEEHFGRAKYFTLIEVRGNNLLRVKVLEVPWERHRIGDLPRLLMREGVELVLTDKIGWRAKEIFSQMGIEVREGYSGKIRQVLDLYLKGSLSSGNET